jgi:CRP-like cAMP-binding protein
LRFLEAYPRVSIKLMEAICERLRAADQSLENMVFMSIPNRLIHMLRALSDQYGVVTAGGIEIRMKISQGELANLIGASRESVNKQLRIWEDAGLLKMAEGWMQLSQQLLAASE